MLDLVAKATTAADEAEFETAPAKYQQLAHAALGPLGEPTEAMVDAAHEATSFDIQWIINSRRDFRCAVKALIAQAQRE